MEYMIRLFKSDGTQVTFVNVDIGKHPRREEIIEVPTPEKTWRMEVLFVAAAPRRLQEPDQIWAKEEGSLDEVWTKEVTETVPEMVTQLRPEWRPGVLLSKALVRLVPRLLN